MALIKRSYKVGMRFGEDKFVDKSVDKSRNKSKKRSVDTSQEQEANELVRQYQQIVQHKIVELNLVDNAYELLDENPKLCGTKGARHLAKKVADGSNIGQVSTTYALSAVNGAIDREHKLSYLFKLFDKHPKEAVSWMVFQRTPFLEASLSKILGVKFDYSSSLVYSAGRMMKSSQADIILPRLTREDFLDALDEFTLEVRQRIEQSKKEEKYDKEEKNMKIFLRKLEFLYKHKEFLLMCLYHWLMHEHSQRDNPLNSRWKSLKRLSKEFSFMLGYKRNRRLFSAIRAVVVHALSSCLDETVKNICETVYLRDLVAKPYTKHRTTLAPVNLIMGSKYVITRPGNSEVLTQLALADKQFTLGIRNANKRGHIIHGDVIISKRIHKMLVKGASITSLSIRSGDAPSHKIRVTLNLEGNEESFLTTEFLKVYPDLKLKPTDIIGLDVNRVGPYVLVFSQEISLPQILITICQRYLHLGEEISKLSTALSRRETVKLRGEINRVYKRRKRLLKEIKIQCKLLCAAVLVQAHTKQFNVEDLVLSAKGKRGALAKAILNMPDEINIFEQAVVLASSYSQTQIELNCVNPFRTSSKHYDCGGKLAR
ncbi:MAG: hypothetical protein ACC656_04750, partial [Candidatus Heimdallarchaeota archaeon]